MKYIILILLLLPFFSLAQNCKIPTVDEKFEIQEITTLENGSRDEIYNASIIALTELLKDQDEHIELKSRKEGVILAKFTAHVHKNGVFQLKNHYFRFTLRVEFKDKRYRTTVNYLNHEYINNNEFICACPNDFTNEKCGIPIHISKAEWRKQKCNALQKVDELLMELNKQIDENVNDKDW